MKCKSSTCRQQVAGCGGVAPTGIADGRSDVRWLDSCTESKGSTVVSDSQLRGGWWSRVTDSKLKKVQMDGVQSYIHRRGEKLLRCRSTACHPIDCL